MSGTSSDNQKSTFTPLNGVEGKVAIPRLPNEHPGIHPFRTTSACSACREKKAKCDGQRPRCLNCIQLDRVCTYTGSKRDNQKLQLHSLQRKIEVYEALLGEIIAQATINERVSVNNIIKKHFTASPEVFSDILASESLTKHHVQVPNSKVSLGQMYQSMSHNAKLKRPITKDPPVRVNSIKFWTSIVENDTASHLLSFYFTWENPTWNLIDLDMFLQDLETHYPGRYCSRLLVHILLFFGCSFSYRLNRITDRREEKGLGQKLYDQIQLLWENDKGSPDLPTIQSGILLGLLSCTFGVDRLGTQFIMNGAKFYLQSGYDTVERCSESGEEENELSSAELSQEMVSWAIFDIQALASQVYRKVSHWPVPPPQRCSAQQAARLDEDMEWKPYPFDLPVFRPHYYTTLRYRSALAAIVNEVAAFSLRLTGTMTKDDQEYCYKLYNRIVTWKASLPPAILPENNTTPHILCLHFYYQATLISLSTLFTTKASPITDSGEQNKIDFDHVKFEAMETIGSLILIFKHRHGWKSIPIVMLHYFCLAGVHATSQLDGHNPKWALVLESCVVGLWHMSLGWGRLCKAFLRTIELVLKSNDPDPSLVPIKVTSIFKHLNSDMWSATDVASLSADYVVQRVSSKANVRTAGSVSHQTVEDLIRAMENL
ncbi:hypothetical protein N7499_009122 [Penicillium canescens]|nr:hypothetical protein N7499_009122 [Penicillium canescens]KAJ6169791.1 hypothetical protein N7485_007137 [Penicillium canescens]